jgi:hypothetical protein
MKSAWTLRATDIETVQSPVPVQAPDQPLNFEPEADEAVNFTTALREKSAEQFEGQLMPAGRDATEPVPSPPISRDSCFLRRSNSAVTAFASLTVITQLPDPTHPPDHPANTESELGEALSVIDTFFEKNSEQSVPQAIPDGADRTVPVPSPFLLTVTSYRIESIFSKVAFAEAA